MKKLLPFLLLFTGIVNAQIINIPDPDFKAFLLASGSFSGVGILDSFGNPIILDANFDGEIDQSEALMAYSIDISIPTITSLEGIEHFTNLQQLMCFNMTGVTSLDVSALTNLTVLDCRNNQLSSLDVSNHLSLTSLYCSDNILETLNISNCPALMNIGCADNSLSVLDVSGKPNLRSIYCELNNIGALDLSAATQLEYLSCRNNMLTSLDLTNTINITDLNCGVNLFTSLDVSHLPRLINFHCAASPITAIDLSNNPHLGNLNLRYTNITSIDLSALTELFYLTIDGSHLSTIDISNSPWLCYFNCADSSALNTVFMKNGADCTLEYILTGNPNLQYVCTDDSKILYFINYFVNNNMPAVNVNSYCTFVPGEIYNSITGTTKFDADNNGCDAADPYINLIKLNLSDETATFSTFTNDGAYKFYTQAGNFTVTPEPENAAWFTFTPATAVVNFPAADGSSSINDFCVAPNGIHPDLEIVITPVGVARPGFNAVYKIVYRNKGNQTMSLPSGISFSYNANFMTFVESVPATSMQNTGSANWDYSNLLPFETRSILVTMHINAPGDSNSVNVGDELLFNAEIAPANNDETIDDNLFIFHQTVVGSFDPNAIECLEGNSLAPTAIGKYLHYNIQFENTGNYDAENIVVKDIIDTDKYDINSLQLINASHEVYTRVKDSIVEFIFKDINLAPSEDNLAAANPPIGGHGNVLFKIKSKTVLTAGDFVNNAANIYFDYNFPVATNDEVTTFIALNNTVFVKDYSVTVYPNPARDKVSIHANSKLQSIELFDIQGRILQTQLENKETTTLDISGRQDGTYFLKITSEKGSTVEKLVKQ